jgi:hypothetical protein
MADEVGWLIEHLTEPIWWTGWPGSVSDSDFWTNDSLKAVRFARREDAETIAHFDFDGECRVTEHMWADTPLERLERRLDQHVKEAAERVGKRVAEAVAKIKDAPPPGGVGEGWMPIESAPRDGTEFIGWLPVAKKARAVLWRRDWEQWQTVPGYAQAKPTHWQPLPSAPTPPLGKEDHNAYVARSTTDE